MKVILQENVEGLGYLGDVLTVAKGYARNYLLPRKKAVVAEERQVKLLQHIKRQIDKKEKKIDESFYFLFCEILLICFIKLLFSN